MSKSEKVMKHNFYKQNGFSLRLSASAVKSNV